MTHPADRLRRDLSSRSILPFIGVYDAFSATVAARHFDGLFVSGFGFAASHYGLPDIGFISWSDMVDYVARLRTVLPHHHLVVDIDDGYVDVDVACLAVRKLRAIGASAIVLEDQQRPRRCGHVDGKQILELDSFLRKLDRVIDAAGELFVVARTDAGDDGERMRRAEAFARAGADAVLCDGIEQLDVLHDLSGRIDKPLMFNQIAGGKSPTCSLGDLYDAGVSLVNYSTPCLFAAQAAMDGALCELAAGDGSLPVPVPGEIGVRECTEFLHENLARMNSQSRPPSTLPSSAEK